jgi:hypothetical protein
LTVAGTVALLGSLELRLTVSPPAGAKPPLRLKVRLPVMPIPNGDPVKTSESAVTVTITVPAPDV